MNRRATVREERYVNGRWPVITFCAECEEAGCRPPATRHVVCLGDPERADCAARLAQTQQANGTWRPWWCPECNAAHAARQERRRAG